MKISTIFKYIFIVFAIGIIIYGGYKIYKNNNQEEEQENDSQTVAQEEIIQDIRLAVTNYDTINPILTNNKEILNIDTLIFEPLFTFSSDYILTPCLAKECSKTGDNTYVIKVNNSVNWQDGTSFMSKDVAFTIDVIKQSNSIYKYNVEHITNVEVVDASTLKLTLDGNVPFFEYNLTFPILSSNYYLGEDFFTSSKTPIGTGRYKISSINSNSITLSKNENWRNPEAEEIKLDNIKINLYTSMGEAFNSFKIGNVDVLNTTNTNFGEYIGTIGFNKVEYAAREFDFLALNCNDVILKDKAVRQALGYAIDKDAIVSSVYNNQKFVSQYPLDYGNYLYTAENVSSGYNAEQAKKVLEDGGWTYRNGSWKKEIDGSYRTLRLKIAVNKDQEGRVQASEKIKEQLKDIGIEVTINKITNDQYSKYISNKDYQILYTGVYNSFTPDLTYYFSSGNIENYYNEEMQELINNSAIIKDSKQQKEIFQKIYTLYKEDVPFIGICRNKNITITSQSLYGNIEPSNYTTYNKAELWYRK